MFYWGLAVGLFSGTLVGILIAALCQASKQGDKDAERHSGMAEMHKRSYGGQQDYRKP